MDAPPAEPRSRSLRAALSASVRAGRLGLALAVASLSLGASATAQDSGLSPDQVFRTNPRTGKVETIAAVVTESSLSKVRVERPSGDSDQFENSEIVDIVWSSAPTSYKDAETYLARGDYERAIAMFRSAATDDAARDVVQAAARRGAARALLSAGSLDINRYDECVAECDRFLTEHAANRDVPAVRWLKARAQRLAGKNAESAQSFKALYEEGANDPATEGYDRAVCLHAGLDAAEAFLAAGDTLGARELYATLTNSLQALIASLDETVEPGKVAQLEASRAAATLGEGFCLLADGQLDPAVSFFEGQRSMAGQGASGATLGLAEAYLAKGRNREAQIEFARVSAVDFASDDNRARALFGLARTAVLVKDTNSSEDAKRYLTAIQQQYADTPAARDASELLKSL